MKMNELTVSEREMLDKLNKINCKLVPDERQSLWNVCYGYLNGMIKESLINEPEKEIKKILDKVNSSTPAIHPIEETIVMKVEKPKKSANKALF